MFIDSHAHLTTPSLAEDLEHILSRAQEAKLKHIINICTDIPTLKKGLELSQKHPWIYNTASTTPHDVEKEGEEVFPIVAQCAREGKLIAIGETGLDYFYTHSAREIQKDFLRRYLHLALECQLPVVIHCRDAFDDFFEILDAEYQINDRHAPGVLHCFTGTVAEAEEVLKRDWFVSFSGIITFKRSEELREAVKLVPLEKIFIETDSPYLAPQSRRGKVNEPSYIIETAQMIADIKNVPLEEVAHTTARNIQSLFQI